MRAMVLEKSKTPLQLVERPTPDEGEILIAESASTFRQPRALA